MRLPRLAAAAIAAAALMAVTSAAPAAEPTKVTCARAAEDGQRLRAAGKLRDALAQLTACAQSQCPSLIRTDCGTWRAEVEAALPSIVVRATAPEAPARELVDVEVDIDGVAAAKRLDGRALPLDPGEHRLVFRVTGRPPVEQSVVIRVGEKHRLIEVSLPSAHASGGEASTPATLETTSTRSRPHVTPTAWVLLGVGAAGLASFGYFGVGGYSDVRSMRETCRPRCAPEDVQSAQTRMRVGDVSLAIGLAALAGAGWLIWRGPGSSTTLEVAPAAGGGIVSLRRGLGPR